MSKEAEGQKHMPGFADEQSAEFERSNGAARGAAGKKGLRARPVKGAIDHPALTREIIARFPKILAALAK